MKLQTIYKIAIIATAIIGGYLIGSNLAGCSQAAPKGTATIDTAATEAAQVEATVGDAATAVKGSSDNLSKIATKGATVDPGASMAPIWASIKAEGSKLANVASDLFQAKGTLAAVTTNLASAKTEALQTQNALTAETTKYDNEHKATKWIGWETRILLWVAFWISLAALAVIGIAEFYTGGAISGVLGYLLNLVGAAFHGILSLFGKGIMWVLGLFKKKTQVSNILGIK